MNQQAPLSGGSGSEKEGLGAAEGPLSGADARRPGRRPLLRAAAARAAPPRGQSRDGSMGGCAAQE